MNPADFPGACVPHLIDTGTIVQATGGTVDGVEVCAACASAHAEAKEQATTGVDASFDGKRFHRHARNCGLCRAVVTGVKVSPRKLCFNGRKLYAEAVRAAKAGGAVAN